MSLVDASATPTESQGGNNTGTVDPATNAAPTGTTEGQNPTGTSPSPWYYDETLPGQGERPEWLKSKYKSAADQAKAYNELEKKFGAFKGAPDEYSLEIPDMPDMKFDKENPFIKGFLEDAKKNNVSQEYATSLLKTYADMYTASQPDPQKELEKLGANAKHDIQILDRWAANSFSKEEHVVFKNMITTADSVRLFEKMRGMLTGADTAPKNPQTQGESKADVLRMIHDERYEKDEGFRNQVREKLARFG